MIFLLRNTCDKKLGNVTAEKMTWILFTTQKEDCVSDIISGWASRHAVISCRSRSQFEEPGYLSARLDVIFCQSVHFEAKMHGHALTNHVDSCLFLLTSLHLYASKARGSSIGSSMCHQRPVSHLKLPGQMASRHHAHSAMLQGMRFRIGPLQPAHGKVADLRPRTPPFGEVSNHPELILVESTIFFGGLGGIPAIYETEYADEIWRVPWASLFVAGWEF